MERKTRVAVAEFLLPILMPLYCLFKAINKIFLSWWLGPWLQRRNNDALWRDLKTDFSFLFEKGESLKEKTPKPLPFDYASVYLSYENLRFCFTRGRDEIHVLLAPQSQPTRGTELRIVVAAIESKYWPEVTNPRTLAEAADMLRPRLAQINDAFSPQKYPEFSESFYARNRPRR